MSLSVFGLFAICPAMADSYASHLSTSVAQTKSGSHAHTQASTNAHAMGYGRQNYYNQHLMPGYYNNSYSGTSQSSGGGGGSAAPTYQNAYSQSQNTGGATQRSYGSTSANQGVVQTYNWNINGKLKSSTTRYK